jgi:hypothetical protein
MTHLRWVMSYRKVFDSPSHAQSWSTGQNTNALHISYSICSNQQQMFIHAQARFADWWHTFVGSWAFKKYLTVLAILSLELQGRIPNALHISYNIRSYEQQMFIHAQARFADWWLTFVGSWAFNRYLTVLAILSFLSLELQGRIPMLCISPITFAVMNNKCFIMRKSDLRTNDSPSLGHELSKSIWQS